MHLDLGRNFSLFVLHNGHQLTGPNKLWQEIPPFQYVLWYFGFVELEEENLCWSYISVLSRLFLSCIGEIQFRNLVFVHQGFW